MRAVSLIKLRPYDMYKFNTLFNVDLVVLLFNSLIFVCQFLYIACIYYFPRN